MLEAKANSIGQKLDDNFDYLQENYLMLIKKSIFKSGAKGVGILSVIISSLVGHERLQEAIFKVANPLADKAAGWIENLLSRMGKKEKE
jgi:hypothetical protein